MEKVVWNEYRKITKSILAHASKELQFFNSKCTNMEGAIKETQLYHGLVKTNPAIYGKAILLPLVIFSLMSNTKYSNTKWKHCTGLF